jgi:hypothetical protein
MVNSFFLFVGLVCEINAPTSLSGVSYTYFSFRYSFTRVFFTRGKKPIVSFRPTRIHKQT